MMDTTTAASCALALAFVLSIAAAWLMDRTIYKTKNK